MSISLREMIRLAPINKMTLVAGVSGLDKHVDKVGILDFEIIEGVIGHFGRGDFVLTTLTPVRSDKTAIIKVVEDLIACQISGLAIKNIYLKTIYKEICELADQAQLPIFIFDESIYFEDIMETIIEGVKSKGYFELIETKIETLYKNELNQMAVKAIASELNPYLKDHVVVHYLSPKTFLDTMDIADRFRRSRHRLTHHSLFKFRSGLLLILSYDQMNHQSHLDLDFIFNMLGIQQNSFYIGKIDTSLDVIDEGIKASVFACKVSKIEEKSFCDFNLLGNYQLLMKQSDKWLKRFSESTLKPLKSTDNKLMDTAYMYFECKGDLQLTATKLYQHKNTIRYRLSKIKDLLCIDSDLELFERLSMAIRCEKLSNKSTDF